MRVTSAMQSLIRKIGKTRGLDPAAEKLSGWVDAATRSPAVKNALSGSWLGHQAHPMLTDLPIGAWGAATVLDLTGLEQRVERYDDRTGPQRSVEERGEREHVGQGQHHPVAGPDPRGLQPGGRVRRVRLEVGVGQDLVPEP